MYGCLSFRYTILTLLNKVWKCQTQVVLYTCNLKLGRWRQENQNFNAKFSDTSHSEPGLQETLSPKTNKQIENSKIMEYRDSVLISLICIKVHCSNLVDNTHSQGPCPVIVLVPLSLKQNSSYTVGVRVCMSPSTPITSKDHLHSYVSPCTTLVPEAELKLGGSASVWGIILRNSFHSA